MNLPDQAVNLSHAAADGKTLTAKVVNMYIGLISHQAALSNKPYNVKIYQSNLFAKLSASDYKYKDVKSLTRTNANPLDFDFISVPVHYNRAHPW